MFGFVRKSVADELQRRLNVAAADRDHLYELVDYEQERAIDLIKSREEARDVARGLDVELTKVDTRIGLIELIARSDTSYFVVAIQGENIFTGAEVLDPYAGLDIGEGISTLLDELTEDIASRYGIDLDALRAEIEQEDSRGPVQNFYIMAEEEEELVG